MPKELAKQYAPQGTEDRIYQNWCDKGYFHTQIDRSKKPFTIVMPPPNVTGQLHMGHALDETLQDILIRYKRMQGYSRPVGPRHRPRFHRHRGQDRGGDERRGPDQGRSWAATAFWSAPGHWKEQLRRPHRRAS